MSTKKIEELTEFNALNANEGDFVPVVDMADPENPELKKATIGKIKDQMFVMSLNILKKRIITIFQSIKAMTPQQLAAWADSYLADFAGLEFGPVDLVEKLFTSIQYANLNSINTGIKLLGAPIVVLPDDTESYEYDDKGSTKTWTPADFDGQNLMQNSFMTETQFKTVWAPAVMENWETFAAQFDGTSWVNLLTALFQGSFGSDK